MPENKCRGISAGRERKEAKPGQERKRRKFTESFAFTAGLAFFVVYVAGMIATSGGEKIKYDGTADAVAVFAPSDGNDTSSDSEEGFWELLDDCLERAFGKGKDGAK